MKRAIRSKFVEAKPPSDSHHTYASQMHLLVFLNKIWAMKQIYLCRLALNFLPQRHLLAGENDRCRLIKQLVIRFKIKGYRPVGILPCW